MIQNIHKVEELHEALLISKINNNKKFEIKPKLTEVKTSLIYVSLRCFYWS